MCRFIYLLFLFFLCSLFNQAKADDLNLKFLTPSKRVVEPGATFNAMVTIENNSESSKEILIRHQSGSDADWKMISDYSSIRVEKKSTLRKIIGLKVPANIQAGDFTVLLEGVETSSMKTFGQFNIPVQVMPRYSIAVETFKMPEYIFSSEDMVVDYLIQNRSNLNAKIKVRVINGSEIQVEELDLPKDSSFVKTYKAKTDKLLTSPTRKTIIIVAQVVDLAETETSTSASVDIYPSAAPKYDKYKRFPVQISGVAAISNRSGQQLYGGMYDVFGSGLLGNKEDKKLEFHLRGPDRSGNPLFGMNDEYSLKYATPRFSMSVGHSNFGLSELTESSRSGLGAEINYRFKKFAIGAYYAQPRYYPLIKNLASANIEFNLNLKNRLNIGFLTKVDTFTNRTNLFSIESKNSIGKQFKSDFELALSERQSVWSKAIKSSLNMTLSHWSSHLVLLYAEPKFLGYVSNSIRINAGSSLQLNKATYTINYDLNSTNMALDTFYTNLPYSNNLNLTANFRFLSNQTLSVSCYYNILKDRSPTPLFDYTKTSGRLSYQSRVKSFNLSVLGDVGRMENMLLNTTDRASIFYSGTLTGYYFLNKKLSASLFTNYQGGKQKSVTGNNLFYYGGTLTASPNDNFSISVQYNSDYEWKYYTTDRSLLSLNIFGRINSYNELQLQANYNLMRNTLDQKEYNVQLKYMRTINMPVSRKKNIGSLTGKIIDHGVGRVSGIIVNVNGIRAITDKNGNFKIPVLPVGQYMVTVRTNMIGIYAITEEPGPHIVKILDNKISTIEIALTNSGRIAGQLQIQEDEKANQKDYIPVKESIDKLIVEASNGKEIYRKYTNSDGSFHFDDLRPGSWQVKIYPNGIPTGYSLINSIFKLDIKSGQSEKLIVLIRKKARRIQFQMNTKK